MSEEIITVDNIVKEFSASTAATPAPEKKQAENTGDSTAPQSNSATDSEEQAETHSDGDSSEGLPEVEEGDAPESVDGDSESVEADEADSDPKKASADDFIEIRSSDGKTSKISKQEAAEGYLRQQDYTQKTTELAGKHKQLEADAEQFTQHKIAVLTELTNRLKQLDPVSMLNAQLKQALEIGDTEIATKLRLDIIETQRQMDQYNQSLAWEKSQQEKQTTHKNETERAQFLTEQRQKLHEKLKWISTPEGAKKFQSTVAKAMDKVGFTADEVKGIDRPDHRNAILAYYAGKYLETLDSKPAVAQALKGKAVAPSTGARKANTGKSGKIDAASRSFDRNPSIDSLVSVYQAYKG